MTSMS